MPSPKFVAGATTLTFTRAPQRPRRPFEVFQAQVESAGAAFFGFDSFDSDSLLVLRWPLMPTADLEALETFMFDTVDGMSLAFTYTDVAGVAYTVRFASSRLAHVERAADRHDVTIVLEITV